MAFPANVASQRYEEVVEAKGVAMHAPKGGVDNGSWLCREDAHTRRNRERSKSGGLIFGQKWSRSRKEEACQKDVWSLEG